MTTTTIPPFQEAGQKIIPVGAGVSFQWLHEGKIIAFTAENVTRSAVDAWTDAVIAAELTYFTDRPVRLLIDIGTLPLTPYNRKRSEEVVQRTKHLYGKTAVVLRPSVISHTIRFFVENLLRKSGSTFERRIFFARNVAIEWLLEKHPREEASPRD